MLLTLAQAAERLGMAAGTLRHQAGAGRLQASRYGTVWLVTEDEVERYRREQQGRPGRPVSHGSPPAR